MTMNKEPMTDIWRSRTLVAIDIAQRASAILDGQQPTTSERTADILHLDSMIALASEPRLSQELRAEITSYVSNYPGMDGVRFREEFKDLAYKEWALMLLGAKRELGLI